MELEPLPLEVAARVVSEDPYVLPVPLEDGLVDEEEPVFEAEPALPVLPYVEPEEPVELWPDALAP